MKFFRLINSRFYRLLGGRSSEGITNRQLSINYLAVVKIFGKECRASSSQRSGNDQRVIDVISVLLRNFECRFMHFNSDRERRRAENSKGIQRLHHVTPGHQDFSSSDRSKFVQDLHSEYPSRCEEFFSLRASWVVLRHGIDQHIRVEECLGGH